MALIKCPECGRMISEYSKCCIHCGCPMEKIKDLLKNSPSVSKTKNIKTSKKKDKDLDHPFLSKLNENDLLTLNKLDRKLFKYKNFIIVKEYKNHKYYFAQRDGKTYQFCRLDKEKDSVVFYYYQNPLTKTNERKIKLLPSLIDDIVDKALTSFSQITGIATYKDVDKKALDEDLTELINKAIKARKPLNPKGNKKIQLVNDLAAFVNNEIMQNALRDHAFKNEEEFKRFRSSYMYAPKFFGHSISFKKLTDKTALLFLEYYKAARTVGSIRSYEDKTTFKIIDDQSVLIESLYNMIHFNELDFSKIKGINSNIRLVPQECWINEIDEINKIINTNK